MAAAAVDIRVALNARAGRRLVAGLVGLTCALAAQAGGVILDRATSSSVSCRQSGVEWLGAGSRTCAAAVRAQGGETGTAAAAAAARSAGATPLRGNDEGRRQILRQELSQERARLAALQLAGREPGAAEAVQRSRQDVDALERELARLAP